MRWTVLSVAYPFAPVSEDAVGGAEQVLATLDRALVEAGHRSIVMAAAGSTVRGELLPLPAVPELIDNAVRARIYRTTRKLIEQTPDVDLIHMHGIDFAEYLPSPGTPVLATLHLPLAWYPEGVFRLGRPRTFLHCVSASQQRRAPAGIDLLPAIPNGVDLETFHPRARKQSYAMMLGRICPEKGVDIALRACRSARVPLLIGGQVYPYAEHETYFREKVAPLLDACRRFLGPLGLKRKAALLAAARCLLIPSLAAETSSLAAMEAAACGTPVIAFRAGALTEIVEDGRTGVLVDNEEELSAAIGRASQIDSAICRFAAESRFGQKQTIHTYFDTYDRLIQRS